MLDLANQCTKCDQNNCSSEISCDEAHQIDCNLTSRATMNWQAIGTLERRESREKGKYLGFEGSISMNQLVNEATG